jgi:hypothetical protein
MMHFFWSSFFLEEHSYESYEYSNQEIAKWAEFYLSKEIAFHQSSWLSGKVTDRADDILLGHPTWDSRNSISKATNGSLLRNWVKDNALQTSSSSHPNTYIMMPWVPEFPSEWTNNMPNYEEQLLSAKKIFALCGDIWIKRTLEKLDDSIQSKVKDKLIHCNMGVASHNLKAKKKRFNPVGDRQLLHISNLSYEYKGVDITFKSLQNVDALLHVASLHLNRPRGLETVDMGRGSYTFNFLGGGDNNNADFNNWIVENCDFYIHTGRMDAQSTTILENCARGLIPLVTPESGFSSPHAIYLTLDPTENQKIIEWALNLPESELLKRSQLIQEQVIKEHNWEGIFSKIWNEITKDIESRSKNNLQES